MRPTGSVGGDLPPVDLAIPQLMRFEDPDESHNDIWFQLNRAKEDGLSISSRRISRLAWAILGLLDADTIARRRRRNFRHLASRLGPWAFLAETSPRFVPVGFPVRLPSDEREKIRQYLYRQRVLPAVHWSNLPSPPHEFAGEHALASTLLTLPCDQRYGAPEMERVADLFIKASLLVRAGLP